MAKIADILTTTFRLPLAGSLNWGKFGHMSTAEHVLVRVVTDTGRVGVAEALPRPTIYGETPQSIHTIIQDYIKPALLGLPLDDDTTIAQVLTRYAANNTATGAIDIALHEARALSRGITLLEYLNPPHKQVRVSYILGIADRDTMLAEAQAVYEQGVRVLKVKVGRDFEHDAAIIDALRHTFAGTDMQLYADANEGLQPETAVARLQALAGRGLLFVEEPLPVELIAARTKLRAANIIPLIADDSAFSLRDLSRELYFDTFDILNIKTARTGYSQSLKMLALARSHGKGVMVGSQASSSIGAIRAAMFAGLEGIDHPSELSFFLKLEDDIVTRPITITDGLLDLISLPDIAIDEQKLTRAAAAVKGH
jgi:L-alanine-DL-glutamate epimerase-like enolase superfamily enzyme